MWLATVFSLISNQAGRRTAPNLAKLLSHGMENSFAYSIKYSVSSVYRNIHSASQSFSPCKTFITIPILTLNHLIPRPANLHHDYYSFQC
jgi:hypothetical protein